jgi:hypothetical protein
MLQIMEFKGFSQNGYIGCHLSFLQGPQLFFLMVFLAKLFTAAEGLGRVTLFLLYSCPCK